MAALPPALPLLLTIQLRLQHFVPALSSFLNSLPLPFQWAAPDDEDHTQDLDKLEKMPIHLVPESALEYADQHKAAANWAYARRLYRIAYMEYTEAGSILRYPLSCPHPAAAAVMPRAKRLMAVLFANRAMLCLQDGELKEAQGALEDGESAEWADPTYGKG